MPETTKQLLISYFSGRCTDEEIQLAEAYIASGVNPELVETCMQQAFEVLPATALLPLEQEEQERAWLTFSLMTGKLPLPEVPVIPMRKRMSWMKYAAAVLMLGAALIALQYFLPGSADKASEQHFTVFKAEKGVTKQLRLTDGSLIWLFPGSGMELPDDFNETDRRITLHGKAFFDIAKNPQKPFLVQAGDLTTEVLGTSFEVNTTNKEFMSVMVKTGMVGIKQKGKELLRLLPDQQLRYFKNSESFTVSAANAAAQSNWISGDLVFDNASLVEIFKTLEQWYGVTIDMNEEKWKDKRISMNIRGQSITQVMELLAFASDFKFNQKDKYIKVY